MTATTTAERWNVAGTPAEKRAREALMPYSRAYMTDLRSHEPPRNSGKGTAVNGPMPLAGGDDAHEPT